MKKPRKHGLSRLERLLVKSISLELKCKSLKAELCALSVRVAKIESLYEVRTQIVIDSPVKPDFWPVYS
jgi:hypothetical protein